MRFSTPQRRVQASNSYGLHRLHIHDSDYDNDSDTSTDSADSFICAAGVPTITYVSPRVNRTPAEVREISETLAAIRLRASHDDPYADWERMTHKEALRVAKKRAEQFSSTRKTVDENAAQLARDKIASVRAQQAAEIATYLAALARKRQQDEDKLRANFKERDRLLWERIEAVINAEELRARRAWEDAERRRNEELRRKADVEAELEAEAERKRFRNAEEQRLKEELIAKNKDAEAAQEHAEAQTRQAAAISRLAAVEGRQRTGQTTAREDWQHARTVLKKLKGETMPSVKLTDEWRKLWNELRRKMTARIGQLTSDEHVIQATTNTLCGIVRPTTPHPAALYQALLSSLAKSILAQAETEVSASPRTAVPLARVTALLLQALPDFASILWARFVQRAGGWAVPALPPMASDLDDEHGRPLTKEEYRKLCGYCSPEESQTEYTSRIVGMLTLYFSILHTSTTLSEPLPPQFAQPRYWTYISRLLCSPDMLKTHLAPQVLTAALEVGGRQAAKLWGRQFHKLLALLHRTLSDKLLMEGIGGSLVEGRQGRIRVQLEVERLLRAT